MRPEVPPSAGWPSGHCPRLQAVIELIGARWTGSIMLAVLGGAERFTDIRAWVPGLSDRLLCERLRRLEGAGLVRRTGAGREGAGYAATEPALALIPVLRQLAAWADRWDIAGSAPEHGCDSGVSPGHP
ncbi:helix-turn-helix transcriptional regulator [Blastococcus sp. KM273128]|nr:helix-turn-helix transcriptional regulator [Blastococcus sp. KM273128]